MEELHEFANILTKKEEEHNATVEQAANAFTQMDEEFENKIEQAANAFTAHPIKSVASLPKYINDT